MERYTIRTLPDGTKVKYFNWSCVPIYLSEMERKAEMMRGTPLGSAADETFYASHYYITTGRAGTEWIKAWTAAGHEKLIKYVAKTYDGSTVGAINSITEYLKRYCKLDQLLQD